MGLHFIITQLAALGIMGFYVLFGGMNVANNALLITGVASLILIPVTVWIMKFDDRMRAYPGNVWKSRPIHFVIPFLLGICYGQIGNTLIALLNIFDIFDSYSKMQEQVLANQSFLSMMLCIGIVAPIAEELIFRGLVYRRLKDYLKPSMAIVLSASAFGIYHGNMVQFLYATFMGIIFAVLVERTGSLWSSIMAHMGANIWSVMVTCFGTTMLEWGNGVFLGSLYLLMVVGGILGIAYLNNYRPGK